MYRPPGATIIPFERLISLSSSVWPVILYLSAPRDDDARTLILRVYDGL